MAAHTPGPWVAEPTPKDKDPEIDFTDAPFWIADTRHLGEVLAVVHITANNEAEANARLMAKAPELLDCCIELREVLLAALDVIAIRAGREAADHYVDDLRTRGFVPGIIGLRADVVIADAEGRPRPPGIDPDPKDDADDQAARHVGRLLIEDEGELNRLSEAAERTDDADLPRPRQP
jgi:hypothetical protein